jgi:hypothetical protein
VTHVSIQRPILSLTERSRRWARVRNLMRERGFDGLLVAGFRSREMYETYITDDYNEGCVIFPLEGNPVVITWAHLRVMHARWSQERLDESNLGVVGLSSQAPPAGLGRRRGQLRQLTPVTLPPGWFRLATRPISTGSAAMVGMVVL